MANRSVWAFKVPVPEEYPKRKKCKLCHGTGSVTQPNGVRVSCPKGCPGFYQLIGKMQAEQ